MNTVVYCRTTYRNETEVVFSLKKRANNFVTYNLGFLKAEDLPVIDLCV